MSPCLRASPVAAALALVVAAAPLRADEAVTRVCVPPSASARVAVELGPDVSVAALGTWIAGLTCEAVVIAPDVAKHATRVQVIAPAPMTLAEARRLFVRSLEAAGLKVKYARRVYTVTLGPGVPRTCPDLDVGDAVDGGGRGPAREADDDKLAAGVRKLDTSHVELPRALLDQLAADPEILSRAARFLPALRGGAVEGFKVFAVRPTGMVARLGLANGDTVTAIGGVALDSLEHATAALATARTAERIELTVVRHGRTGTLLVTVTP